MNDKNSYSAIIRNAEALRGKDVSHDAARKVSLESLFKSCPGVHDVQDSQEFPVHNTLCNFF